MNDRTNQSPPGNPLAAADTVLAASNILGTLPVPSYIKRQMLRRWAHDHDMRFDHPQVREALNLLK